jgi:acyl transferase domain-containing protein
VEAVGALDRSEDTAAAERELKVAFVFPGQGVRCVNVGRQLYEECPTFRERVHECCRLLEPALGLDLKSLLYPSRDGASVEARFLDTSIAQPAIFTIDYALASLWLEWGIRPAVMLGHSLGEYVAAHLAGVFSLEDVLRAIAFRGRVMQRTVPGSMLAAGVPADVIAPFLGPGLSLAAVNSPADCVVAGVPEAVDEVERELKARRAFHRRLRTCFAFHSSTMDPAVPEFVEFMRTVPRKSPSWPYISCVTGEPVTEAQVSPAEYWGEQLRRTVQFAKSVVSAQRLGCQAFLEVGPGAPLTPAVASTLLEGDGAEAMASLPHPGGSSDLEALQQSAARLWARGVEIDWARYHGGDLRLRVALPTYAFDRRRFWLDARDSSRCSAEAPVVESTAPPSSQIAAGDDPCAPSDHVFEILEDQLSLMRRQLLCWSSSAQTERTV